MFVSLQQVKTVDAKLLHTPAQAIRCALHGYETNTRMSSDAAFEASLDVPTLSCKFLERDTYGRYIVELFTASGVRIRVEPSSGATKNSASSVAIPIPGMDVDSRIPAKVNRPIPAEVEHRQIPTEIEHSAEVLQPPVTAYKQDDRKYTAGEVKHDNLFLLPCTCIF